MSILFLTLYKIYNDSSITRESGEASKGGVRIEGAITDNLRFPDDITLMRTNKQRSNGVAEVHEWQQIHGK